MKSSSDKTRQQVPLSRRTILKSMAAVAVAASAPAIHTGCGKTVVYDLVIAGGMVYDGLGSPPQRRDIGITGDTIVAIEPSIDRKQAGRWLDASDMAVCPGFVDPHSHSDTALLTNPKAESKIRQGVTTEINGNCGISPLPQIEDFSDDREAVLDSYGFIPEWQDFAGMCRQVEARGVALNSAQLVGHGSLRTFVMGNENRPPTAEELEQMQAYIRTFMQQGAFGFSTGLEYAPGMFAGIEELIALNSVVAGFDGIYASHMRNEDLRLVESIEETIRVGVEGGTRVQVSHLKAAYPEAWGNIDRSLELLETKYNQGVRLLADAYPYLAGATTMAIQFPADIREGTSDEFIAKLKDPDNQEALKAHLAMREKKFGGWENLVIAGVSTDQNKDLEGLNVIDAAAKRQQEPWKFMVDLMIEERLGVATVNFFMSEENLYKKLRHPLVVISSDGSALAPYGKLGEGQPHPRSYGTFPKVLGTYVREKGILSLEAAIHKMSKKTAEHFGLFDRGEIAYGMKADLVVFDPDTVADGATYDKPHTYPTGIPAVVVNGTVVIDQGEHTGELPGRMLRSAWHRNNAQKA